MKNRAIVILSCLLIIAAGGNLCAQTTNTNSNDHLWRFTSPAADGWRTMFPGIDLSGRDPFSSQIPLSSPDNSGDLQPTSFKVKVDGNIGPSVNNKFTLGSPDMRWMDIYVGPNSLKIGNGPGNQTVLSYSNTSGVSRLEFDIDDDNDLDVKLTENGDIEFVGTLMPDFDAGDNGEILRSNGSTTSPTWVDIQTLAWSKTGNSGTSASTNFIGTTDNTDLVFRTNNVSRARFLTGGDSAGSLMPELDNVYSLGTPANRWKDLYLGPSTIKMGGFINGSRGSQQEQTLDEVSISYVDGALLIDKGLQTNGSVTPNGSNTSYSLGTNTNRWADIYIAGNSLHIGTSAAEATMTYDDALTLLHFNVNGTDASEVTMGIRTDDENNDIDGAGMLGIGATPNTTLDVNGDAAFRFSGLTLDNGANTGVDVGASSAVRITGPTAAFGIHGITGGQNGKVVELYNASGQTMRIYNESSSESTPENRIVTGTGHSFEVRNMNGVGLVYSPEDSRWLIVNETRNTSNLIYTMNTYATFTANQTAWEPDFGFIAHRVSANANRSISGISSVGVQDGTCIVLINVGTSNITLQNESASAGSASYRIITGTGNNETLASNKPATLVYDGASQRWRMLSGR